MLQVKAIRKSIKDLYSDTNVYIKIKNTVYPTKEIHRSVGGDCMILIADTIQSEFETEQRQEDKIKAMVERINFKISYAKENFTGWNITHERRMAEIDGMIDMLSIVTGKDYVVTENGLMDR